MIVARRARPAPWAALALVCWGVAAAAGPGAPVSTDARIAWYRARAGGAGTWPLHARLGLAYLDKARETGDERWHEPAERHLRVSLGYQRNYEALMGLGALEAARHRFADALGLANEAAAAAPGSEEARGLLFEIALALGDLDRASALAREMLAAGPSFAALTRSAALLEYGGDLEGALTAVEGACAAAVDAALPAVSRAWCEVRRGDLLLHARCDAAGAEGAYGAAAGHLPRYYLARERMAGLRAAQGRAEEARDLYSGLLRDHPEAAYRLALAGLDDRAGRTARARRERRRALADLRRAIRSGPRAHAGESALALAGLGNPRDRAGALEVAREQWRARKDWMTADLLAWTSYHAGLNGEAGEAVEAVLRSGTRDTGARIRAAHILRALGREAEAGMIAAEALACTVAVEPGAPRWP